MIKDIDFFAFHSKLEINITYYKYICLLFALQNGLRMVSIKAETSNNILRLVPAELRRHMFNLSRL